MADSTRRAASEVLRLCREKGHAMTDTLAALLVRAVALEKPEHYDLESPLSPPDLASLAQMVSERAFQTDSPSLATIKLQVTLEGEYDAQRRRIEAEQREKDDRVASLEYGVTSMQFRGTKDDAEALERLWRRIFSYIVTAGAMEAALGDTAVEAEVLAALESVFPKAGIGRFVILSADDKAAQLRELALLVLGIRLFNRSIGQGGGGLEAGAGGHLNQAAQLAARLRSEVDLAAEAVDQAAVVIAHKASTLRPSEPALVRLRDEQNYLQQRLAALEALAADVDAGTDATRSLLEQEEQELMVVQDLVGGRVSVPKSQVYPRLAQLAVIYLSAADEKRLMVVRQRIVDLMCAGYALPYRPAATPKDVHDARVAIAGGRLGEPLSSDSGPKAAADPDAAAALAGAERVSGAQALEEARAAGGAVKLELGGFCPVALVRRGGMCVRGELEDGGVRWEGRLFMCADGKAASAFAAAPAEYMAVVLQKAHSMPELVRLLGLQDAFPTIAIGNVLELMAAPVSCDFGVQTPTHFVEKHIDYHYEWNEWALRRRALALANLREKRTHSMQTHLSHFRRESETQCWLPKASTTQTAVVKGTTMPKRVQYIGGLRGPPEVKLNVVNLSLAFGQPYQM